MRIDLTCLGSRIVTFQGREGIYSIEHIFSKWLFCDWRSKWKAASWTLIGIKCVGGLWMETRTMD